MDSHRAQLEHSPKAESQGLVVRRSLGTVRKEFVAMCEPTLRALNEVDRLCAELLEAIESEPLSTLLFDEEPETRPDHGNNKKKKKR